MQSALVGLDSQRHVLNFFWPIGPGGHRSDLNDLEIDDMLSMGLTAHDFAKVVSACSESTA